MYSVEVRPVLDPSRGQQRHTTTHRRSSSRRADASTFTPPFAEPSVGSSSCAMHHSRLSRSNSRSGPRRVYAEMNHLIAENKADDSSAEVSGWYSPASPPAAAHRGVAAHTSSSPNHLHSGLIGEYEEHHLSATPVVSSHAMMGGRGNTRQDSGDYRHRHHHRSRLSSAEAFHTVRDESLHGRQKYDADSCGLLVQYTTDQHLTEEEEELVLDPRRRSAAGRAHHAHVSSAAGQESLAQPPSSASPRTASPSGGTADRMERGRVAGSSATARSSYRYVTPPNSSIAKAVGPKSVASSTYVTSVPANPTSNLTSSQSEELSSEMINQSPSNDFKTVRQRHRRGSNGSQASNSLSLTEQQSMSFSTIALLHEGPIASPSYPFGTGSKASSPTSAAALNPSVSLPVSCSMAPPQVSSPASLYVVRGEYEGVPLKPGEKHEIRFNEGVYIGTLDIEDGMTGYGKAMWNSGDMYSGEWLQDQMHGHGCYVWADGDSYEGKYRHGSIHGFGQMTDSAGTYVGDWVDDVRHGFGKMMYKSGNVYEGQWRKGKRDGHGIFIDVHHHTTYEGEFRNDKKEGHGVETNAEGDVYEGSFSDGCMHGKGTYTWANGLMYTGEFKDGSPVGPMHLRQPGKRVLAAEDSSAPPLDPHLPSTELHFSGGREKRGRGSPVPVGASNGGSENSPNNASSAAANTEGLMLDASPAAVEAADGEALLGDDYVSSFLLEPLSSEVLRKILLDGSAAVYGDEDLLDEEDNDEDFQESLPDGSASYRLRGAYGVEHNSHDYGAAAGEDVPSTTELVIQTDHSSVITSRAVSPPFSPGSPKQQAITTERHSGGDSAFPSPVPLQPGATVQNTRSSHRDPSSPVSTLTGPTTSPHTPYQRSSAFHTGGRDEVVGVVTSRSASPKLGVNNNSINNPLQPSSAGSRLSGGGGSGVRRRHLSSADLQGWRPIHVIGKGSFGAVYKALLADKKIVCCKVIELASVPTEQEMHRLHNEVRLMKQLCHPNVVQYYGSLEEDSNSSSSPLSYFQHYQNRNNNPQSSSSAQNPEAEDTTARKSCSPGGTPHSSHNRLLIFMEYVNGCSLNQVIKKFPSIPFETLRQWILQMVSGVQYLHSRGIVHRDIKGANVLLSLEGVIKLADFGCSKLLDDHSGHAGHHSTQGCNTLVGTPYWMAPEVIRGDADGGYGYKSDIWSVGCTIVEMLTGKPPWPESTSMWAAVWKIANSTGLPTEIPPDLDPELMDFLECCFQRDPKKRPTTEQLLQHPFLLTAIHNHSDAAPIAAGGSSSVKLSISPTPPSPPPITPTVSSTK